MANVKLEQYQCFVNQANYELSKIFKNCKVIILLGFVVERA